MKPTRSFSASVVISVGMLVVWLAFSDRLMAITGGKLDGNGHPNVGAVVIDDPYWGPYQLCSGTLVHERVFLTAGHCVVTIRAEIEQGNITLDNVYVSFNSDWFLDYWHHTLLPISDVFLHPDYTGHPGANDHAHDLGALVLETATGLTPATLPKAGFLDALKRSGELKAGRQGVKFTVVGYGYQLDWPPPEPIWWDTRRFVAQSGYLALNDSWLFMSQNQAAGNGGTGYGDSGGPTFWTDPKTGKEILVSVTSWGDPVMVAIGISYRVDTVESLAFIASVIAGVQD
jgi:hypothetical protein